MIRAASVLGPEFSLRLLEHVCADLGELGPVLAELAGTGLLLAVPNVPDPTYRFRHALIQEATYQGMLRAERRWLHGRAAWSLEAVSEGRLEEVAAVLGHHFAAAGETDRAVHYLEVAGDHATAAFANAEAMSVFRSALDLMSGRGLGADAMPGVTVAIKAKLADVLHRTGRYAEAGEELRASLLLEPIDTLQSARVRIRLGRAEVALNRAEAALAQFDAAERLLAEHPVTADRAWGDVWLELMLEGRALLHLVMHDTGRALAALSAARPVLEPRGSPGAWKTFYFYVASQRAIEHRWRVEAEDIANMRTAAGLVAQQGDDRDVGYVAVYFGWFLFCDDDLSGAREQLESSLDIAERTGDFGLWAASLSRLSATALRRHDVEAVRRLAPHAVAASKDFGHAEFEVGAKSCLAWLAWQDGRFDDILALSSEVDELIDSFRGWADPTMASAAWFGSLDFKWVHLWPLVAVQLRAGNLAEAVAAARQMLHPSQHRLPDELEQVLELASGSWDEDKPEVATARLAQALELARRLDYF